MPDQPVTRVTDRCYYILAKDPEPNPENHGFFSNPGIIITRKGVALLKDHLTFFKTIWDDVAKYYEEGLADFEMKPKIMEEPFMKNVASKWPGYNSTLGKFIAVAVQEYENAML